MRVPVPRSKLLANIHGEMLGKASSFATAKSGQTLNAMAPCGKTSSQDLTIIRQFPEHGTRFQQVLISCALNFMFCAIPATSQRRRAPG